MTDDTTAEENAHLKLRDYQLEMLNESLKQNIIIALDTGAGKMLIAVLHLKHEAECELRKACCTCRCTTSALLMQPDSLDFVGPCADCYACAAAAGRNRQRC
jgi:hypothetical protein